jgi:hypothetical protein
MTQHFIAQKYLFQHNGFFFLIYTPPKDLYSILLYKSLLYPTTKTQFYTGNQLNVENNVNLKHFLK